MRRVLLAAAAGAVAATSGVSCDVNDYCLNCGTQDGGGNGDGGGSGRFDAALHDGGPTPDACVVGSVEVCDDADNDCDGNVDEDVAEVGDACGNSNPPCTVGTLSCVNGDLVCSGVAPTAERCDDIDNDCDTLVDEGDPGGGAECGTDLGECVAGVARCVGGALECQGEVTGSAEICDGKDNDCDDDLDEDIGALGPCPGGTTNGLCDPGQLMCMGGGIACVGRVNPTFELCDDLDQDCDVNEDPTNGYDLDGDTRNCGTCGTVCELPNAIEACVSGACEVGTCEPGFYDVSSAVGDEGCEYACDFEGSVEACNDTDDDCDGNVDEGASPPANLCRSVGACATMTTPVCTAAGWDCAYGNPEASVDAMGNLEPETECDGIDNDCDGDTDESFADLGDACADAGVGECQGFGTYVCDPGDEAAVICNITDPGQAVGVTETCNGRDDNCDGTVDNGFDTGALAEWVTISGGVQIMKYEASRPDATSTNQGDGGGYACSKAGVLPWTNVKQPTAEAACTAMGARLCTEAEWEASCLAGNSPTPPVVNPPTYPIAGPATATDVVFVQAEHFQTQTPRTVSGGSLHTWTLMTTPFWNFTGTSAMRALPDSGDSISNCNNAGTVTGQAARLDFTFNLTATGDYYVWTRQFEDDDNDEGLCVGVGATAPATPSNLEHLSSNDRWQWRRSNAFNVAATGNRVVSVYMIEDGVGLDMIAITRSTSTTPPAVGVTSEYAAWAYASNATTAQPATCNADDYDTSGGSAGDQDDVLPTGSLANCYANGAGANDAYDLSGNVKEWTAERLPGANPQRGGASNNETMGTTCSLDFTLADDDFFFPNVGFRCCR